MQLLNEEYVINKEKGIQTLYGEPILFDTTIEEDLNINESTEKIKLVYLDQDLINESNGQLVRGKGFYLKGPFGRWGVINQNKRLYEQKTMEEAVQKIQEAIPFGLVGELEHPNRPKINYERGCIKINKIEMRPDNTVYGEAKVMDTAYGLHLQQLIKEGIIPGVSTRAIGKLKKRDDGIYIVSEGLKMITVDVVENPSAGTRPNVITEEIEDNNIVNEEHERKEDNDVITFKNLMEEILFGR